jgi:glycerol-3-phosphate dehydrogenase
VVEREPGTMAVVGGKLTTYRSMAEEIVDRVMKHLGRSGVACITQQRPLVPGEPLDPQAAEDELVRDLFVRHGPRAGPLAERARGSSLGVRLVADLPYRWIEVHEAIEREGCEHLIDVLRRRLPLAITDSQQGAQVARGVAELLVRARGGSEAEIREELEHYVFEVQRECRRVPEIS